MADSPQRAVDRTDQVARAALADALTFFPKWRGDVARFAIHAERVGRSSERASMLDRCAEIAREIADVRADLIIDLSDAPQRVAGHSRVVDIERALDNIETTLRDVRARLETSRSIS